VDLKILQTYRGAKYITKASEIYNNLGDISIKEKLFPSYTIDEEIFHVMNTSEYILSFPSGFSFEHSECIRLLLLQKVSCLLKPQWDSVPIDKCFTTESFIILLEAIRKLSLILNLSEEISFAMEKSDGNFQELKFPSSRDLTRKYNSSNTYDAEFFKQILFYFGDTVNKIKIDNLFFEKLAKLSIEEDVNLNIFFFPKLFLQCDLALKEFNQFSTELTEDCVNSLKFSNFEKLKF